MVQQDNNRAIYWAEAFSCDGRKAIIPSFLLSTTNYITLCHLAHKFLNLLNVRTDPYIYTRSQAERSIVSRYYQKYNKVCLLEVTAKTKFHGGEHFPNLLRYFGLPQWGWSWSWSPDRWYYTNTISNKQSLK